MGMQNFNLEITEIALRDILYLYREGEYSTSKFIWSLERIRSDLIQAGATVKQVDALMLKVGIDYKTET